ncbi:MAG: MaoC/PaaZ C-terminal domain-containing protein, partial [Archangium sp.]
LPTYGVVPAVNTVLKLTVEGNQAPGLHYGLDRVLHGEQYTELLRPLPPRATLRHQGRIKDIFDKGKNALVITEVTSYDAQTGEPLVRNEITTFVRGAGGWGGARGPSTDITPPQREPDAVITDKTHENQALLYRLSGDWNPLHADPEFARNFGFQKPILHGLCTFGYVGRHVLNAFAGGDPRLFKSIRVRFAESVLPGETLRTEMWRDGERILVRCKVVERDKVVISNAAVELHQALPKAQAKPAFFAPASAPAPATPAASASVARDVAAEVKAIFKGVREQLGARAPAIFKALGERLAHQPELAHEVRAVFQFHLTEPQGAWVVDARSSPPDVREGTVDMPDTTICISDADLVTLKEDLQAAAQLYIHGKLRVDGDLLAALRLRFLL